MFAQARWQRAARGLATAAAAAPMRRTVLFDWHVKQGGKMVPFAGWDMPVQYKDGVVASHNFVRESAGLFDVSHMLQTRIHGEDRVKFMESLTVTDLQEVPEGAAKLTVFTNEKGGIRDDAMITNAGNHLYLVSNAGCSDKISAHLNDHAKQFRSKGGRVEVEYPDDLALLALQGPKAAEVLAQFLEKGFGLAQLGFMEGRPAVVMGIRNCRVTRCGYTGEDGFEISVPKGKAEHMADELCGNAKVRPAGLGARDSLRLEAGLCLYGHDINEDTSPSKAALTWLIGKRRKAEGGFLGSKVIQQELAKGIDSLDTIRVGMIVSGSPARADAPVRADGESIGIVTSGSPSPTLKQNIAMAYVAPKYRKAGTTLSVEVRGKEQEAVVSKMPFVPSNYYRK